MYEEEWGGEGKGGEGRGGEGRVEGRGGALRALNRPWAVRTVPQCSCSGSKAARASAGSSQMQRSPTFGEP